MRRKAVDVTDHPDEHQESADDGVHPGLPGPSRAACDQGDSAPLSLVARAICSERGPTKLWSLGQQPEGFKD